MTVIARREVYNDHAPMVTITTIRCDGPGCGRTVSSNQPEYDMWISIIGPTDLSAPDLTPAERGPSNTCSWTCLHAAIADLAEAGL